MRRGIAVSRRSSHGEKCDHCIQVFSHSVAFFPTPRIEPLAFSPAAFRHFQLICVARPLRWLAAQISVFEREDQGASRLPSPDCV